MDNIKVGIRVRPLIDREIDCGDVQWTVNRNTIFQKLSSTSPYSFDYVFASSVETEKIYHTLAKPIILSVMEGFNGTIFAYGQTSSGKTHTMMGGEQHAGIIPLSIGGIFEYIDEHSEREFIIRTSYLEIYNESLTDLLNPVNRDLKVREDSQHNVRVHGLTEQAVTEPLDIARLVNIGERNRSVGETNMNDRSSRSHTIFTLTIESRLRDEEGGDGTVRVASLNLVDLAGSERVSATGAEGIRFKEGTFINMSLLVLGNVISKLSEGSSSHIPFRDSKLTRILQPSLGGNAKTCIICTVTPAEIGETHSTLKFASRAKTIKNKPVVNEVLVGEEALLKKLKTYERENEKLRKKLEDGLPDQERQQLTEQLDLKEREKVDLESRMKALQDIIVKSSVIEKPQCGKTKAVRRQTVCPSLLSRDVLSSAAQFSGDILATPKVASSVNSATPFVRKRVTFASCDPSLISPFQPRFDRHSFEKHLQDVQYTLSPSTINRSKSCRPSFIPRTSSTPASSSEDTVIQSTIDSLYMMVDAQIQTDTNPKLTPQTDSADVECQTSFDSAYLPPPDCSNVLNNTCSGQMGFNDSLCIHRQESNRAKERMEMMEFEADENSVKMQELQQQLNHTEKTLALREAAFSDEGTKTANLETKLKDFEIACQAQEEMLLGLQQQLKVANAKVHASREETFELQRQLEASKMMIGDCSEYQQLKFELEQTKADSIKQERLLGCLESQLSEANLKFKSTQAQFDEERNGFSQVISDLKEQLMSLQVKLQGTLYTAENNSPVVATEEVKLLKAKLEESEANRKTEEKEFQRIYEIKCNEALKMQERLCILQEQLENIHQAQHTAVETLLGDKEREEEAEKKWKELSCEMSTIKAHLQEKISLLACKDGQLSNLESSLKLAKNEFVDTQAALLLANKEKNAIESLLSNKEKELECERIKWERLNDEMSTIKVQLQAVEVLKEKELENERVKRVELNYEISNIKAQLQENISLLASRDDQISNLESALTMSQKEFADAQNALLLANKDNNEMSARLSSQECIIAECKSALHTAQEERDDIQELFQITQKERDEAQWVEKQTEEKCCSLEAELQFLKEKSQTSEISKLQLELTELQEQYKELQELFEITEKEKNEAMFHEMELQNRFDDLEYENEQLKAAVKISDGKKKLHEEANESQTSEISKLQLELTELKEQYKEIQELFEITEKEKNEAMFHEMELQNRFDDLEYENEQLKAAVKISDGKKKLHEEANELKVSKASENDIARTSESQKMDSNDTELSQWSTIGELKEMLKAAKKENSRLVAKLQGMASVPSGISEPVVDGSGTVTGLAYYRIRQDKLFLDKENEQLKNKLQRVKNEFTMERERLNKEREETKRYRQERNIFRTKYQAIKDNCSCGIIEKVRNDPTLFSSFSKIATSHSFPEPLVQSSKETNNSTGMNRSKHIVHLEGVHPGRKSLLSFKVPPASNHRKEALSDTKPLTVLKSDINGSDVSSGCKPAFKEFWSDGIENAEEKFFWEKTFMETDELNGKEQDANCKTQ